jgi:hypothetical protein
MRPDDLSIASNQKRYAMDPVVRKHRVSIA